MTLNVNELAVLYPDQLWLEFSPEAREKVWQQTQDQPYSNPPARWNAFLNALCLNTFVSWLAGDADLEEVPKVWPNSADLPSFWEVVSGTAITLGETRIVLIPSDKVSVTELRIPQEWVKIPEWAADYYLAVQVNLEEHWMRVCGCATHQQIQDEGNCDRMDGTYCLDAEDLMEDFSELWLARELYAHRKPKVAPLPALPAEKAEKLLEQLGKPAPYSPRLDVPFQEWGALLVNDRWRQQLYQRRQSDGKVVSAASPSKMPVNLGHWLKNVFNAGWHSLDALRNAGTGDLAFAYRGRNSAVREVSVEGVKLIDLGMQLGNQSVALLVGLKPETGGKVGVRVQLHPGSGQTYLLPNIKLALLSESGKTIQELQSRSQDNYIQLKRFTCPQGKGFRIQVAAGDLSIAENFVIESLAEDCYE